MNYADELLQGKLAVVPTDTVYGLVCRAADQAAVARLYALKKREKKPGTVVAASIEQLVDLGLKARYLKAVADFWPNPITIIIPTGFDLTYLTQNTGSLAVRIPKDPEFVKLLQKTGPLLTSSANHPGEPPANTIQQAKEYFGDSVDIYVDGDDRSNQKPSTIIRVIDDAVEVIREGAVTIDEETGRINT
jgi:tRNA threonylcarbamoyl adenosine modification protein (Sua5/YciO/YrdC/YwlC family)